MMVININLRYKKKWPDGAGGVDFLIPWALFHQAFFMCFQVLQDMIPPKKHLLRHQPVNAQIGLMDGNTFCTTLNPRSGH